MDGKDGIDEVNKGGHKADWAGFGEGSVELSESEREAVAGLLLTGTRAEEGVDNNHAR
jgi:hypothetical protein